MLFISRKHRLKMKTDVCNVDQPILRDVLTTPTEIKFPIVRPLYTKSDNYDKRARIGQNMHFLEYLSKREGFTRIKFSQ
jgi:hypothetical protein